MHLMKTNDCITLVMQQMILYSMLIYQILETQDDECLFNRKTKLLEKYRGGGGAIDISMSELEENPVKTG